METTKNTSSFNPLEELKEILQTNVKGIICRYSNGDLVIEGTPVNYQDVRNILGTKGVPISITRDTKYNIIKEIKVSAIDVRGREFGLLKQAVQVSNVIKKEKSMSKSVKRVSVVKVVKSPKPKKVVEKKEKKQPVLIVQTLAMCQNLKEEIKFLSKKLRENNFVLRGEKIPFRWESKDNGVFHYRCRNEFVEEFLDILCKVGYPKTSIHIGNQNKDLTTVDLFLNFRPKGKVERVVSKKNNFFETLLTEKSLKKIPTEVLVAELLSRPSRTVSKFLTKLRKQYKQEKNQDASPP